MRINFCKYIVAAALSGTLGLSSSVFAAPIMGTFHLEVNGSSTTYTGSFTTEDTTGLVAGDVVRLDEFSLTADVSEFTNAPLVVSFDENSFVQDLTANPRVTGLFGSAILASETVVASLSGNALFLTAPSGEFLLNLSEDTGIGTDLPDFGIGGAPPLVVIQGDQVIPEPGIVALLGAGAFAFGIAGFRRKRFSV